MQDLHGWFHTWNYLIYRVMWVQLNSGHVSVVPFSELFEG
jgi:hypothetical protein